MVRLQQNRIIILVSLWLSCSFLLAASAPQNKILVSSQEQANTNNKDNNTNKTQELKTKTDIEFDYALMSVVVLVKRQACLDFMNSLTNTSDYKFRWQNLDNPVIGVFEDSVSKIPGCGQISLPTDEGKTRPHPNFNKVVFNDSEQIPGAIQLISKKFTKDLGNINSKSTLEYKPVYQACVFYHKNITQNKNIENKLLKSFGEYVPDYPIVIAQNSPQIKVFQDRVDAAVKEIIDNGCDGDRKQREERAFGRRSGAGFGAGGAIGQYVPRISSGSGSASGSSGLGTYGDLASAADAAARRAANAAAGSIGTGDISDAVGPSKTTGGTIPSDVGGPVTDGCPADDPNCLENNNNCPPDDPDCRVDGDPDSDEPCVTNRVGQCIPQVYDPDYYLSRTNITRYSPQSGFLYNIPNPGGEYHTKAVVINGQTKVLDMSMPCKASPDACSEIYSSWLSYSENRQLLGNIRLDNFENNPDQLWLYPKNHFEEVYMPYYVRTVQDAINKTDPINRNNSLPYGPMNN